MAQRRITRSTSKTQPETQQLQSTISSHALITRNKKKIRTNQIDQQTESEMNFLLDSDQQLEAALNPAADFLPQCFQSQPRSPLSSQLYDPGLAFDSELLKACDSNPLNDDWKYRDDEASPPSTQLEMVDGIDKVLSYPSSVLYSPESVAPATSPAAPLTSAEELLQYYLPGSGAPQLDLSPFAEDFDGSGANIPDEDLLDDLSSILSSYEEPEAEADASLSHIRIEFNPPADTVALALSSQYEEGINVFVDDSQSSADDADDASLPDEAPVAGPSHRGKALAAKKPQTASTRGRKRKASSDSDSAESRKKRQNAEAAKNYRKRKAEQMSKVFEEKEEVEKELEKARKKLQGKLNERNILLKMLYESYKQNDDSAKFKILFPDWIDEWYQKQNDD